MGKYLLFILIILPVCFGPICHAQTSVQVSDPRLEMVNNKIHIHYDILNSDPEEKYTISILIKDEEGNIINAKTLEGDIGEEVHGGSNKQIKWDLEADNIILDAFVFVQINAKIIPPPALVVIEPIDEQLLETHQNEQYDQTTSFNRTEIVLHSLFLPGLGLSRVTGNPHWLRGVVGYGCIAGSIVLNRQAVKTYNGIEDLIYFDEINEAYDKSLQQDNISEILTYVAIGIWVTDFIWTLAGTSDLNKRPIYSGQSGFSFGSNVDPLTNIPLVSIRYRL